MKAMRSAFLTAALLLYAVALCGQSLSSQHVTFTPLTDSIAGTQVFAIERDSSGNIWVGHNRGASVYMGAWFDYDTSDGLPDNVVLSIACDDSGRVWFGTALGAVRFDGDTTWFDPSDSIDAHGGRAVYSISCTPNVTWFGTDGGVVSYKPSTLYPYSPYYGYTKDGTNDSLPADRIYGILAETEDTIWVATAEGLVRLVETRE